VARSLPTIAPGLRPEDIIAALAEQLGPARCARLDALAAMRIEGTAVVLEDLFDPHNYGAVLRSCESFGIEHVHTINTRNRFRVSARVTQGSERWLSIHRHGDVEPAVLAVRAAGYRLLAAVPDGGIALDDIDPRERVALAFGNEHAGLSTGLRARCDGEFRVPMHGATQSLNVSVSVAVALYVTTAARRRALGRPGDLDPGALLELRARYYASDTRGYEPIVQRWLAERDRPGRER
jgi:tRNA (guanosine-2'-O-)-methyltransferase